MTVIYQGDGVYRGLSTDTKPTAPAGYRYFAYDTGSWDISDGTYWWMASIGTLSNKRYGFMPIGAGLTVGVGMLAAIVQATGVGTTAAVLTDTTNGRYINYPTLTTTGDNSGFKVNTTLAVRANNPRMRIKFKLASTTLQRNWFGMATNAEPTGDDAFNTTNAFVIGTISGSTNFQIMHNDAAGATVLADTGIAVDTNVHDIRLVGDEANTRFSWSLDGSAYTHLTTDIPSSTANLTVVIENETNESGVAKTFQLYNAFIQADK